LPSTDAVPERFELGTLPYELLAGTTAVVDFIAGLGGSGTTRRERLITSLRSVEAHEDGLRDELEAALKAIPGVTLYGHAAHRTPTLLFTLDGHTPGEVSEHLAKAGVNAPAGSFYAYEPARHLGLGAAGAVRAGLAPYTDRSDVERLVAAVTALTGPSATN